MDGHQQFAQRVRECSIRLAEGGVDALGPLFDLTSHRLVRYAISITRHQQDAEDAVQAALVSVTGRPKLLQSADAPWSYLLRMVRNEALVIGQRKKRNMTSNTLNDLVTYCPVDELELQETYRSVWRALRELPPAQAEVVVLKIWEELTFAQIGDVLEVSQNTAASRYKYAMNKLSQRLQAHRREVRT